MSDINQHGLYLCSWEWLYMGTKVPRGLPNEVFSRHPGLLILFEHIYCDRNALEGEFNAHNTLGWTNSGLFCALTKESIIQPLDIQAHLHTDAGIARHDAGVRSSEQYRGIIQTASDDQLFALKMHLLKPFLGRHGLHAYDFTMADPSKELPMSLLTLSSQLPPISTDHFLFVKRIAELDPKRVDLSNDLQRYEAPHLAVLRRGGMDQKDDYIPILFKRADDHRFIDEELHHGVQERLRQVIEARKRFGDRGGWVDVHKYLELVRTPICLEEGELNSLLNRIVDNYNQSTEALTPRERGSGWWRVGLALLQFIPILDKIPALWSLGQEAQQQRGVLKEPITYVQGSARRLIKRLPKKRESRDNTTDIL